MVVARCARRAGCVAAGLLFWCPTVLEAMAIAVTSYYDELCTNMTGATVLTFGDVHQDDAGNPIIDPFNTCVLDQGAGQILVCELATQENGLILFSDSQCEMTLIDSTTAADCISTHPGIDFQCTGDVECAHRDRCLNEQPLDLSGNGYNVVANQYLDAGCASSASDSTVVVAGDLFLDGPNDGSCFQLLEGGNHHLRRCLTTGSAVLQTFAPNDTTCSGEVWVQETTQYVSNECDHVVEAGGYFYSYVSCTVTEAATVIDGTEIATPDDTPAPVVNVFLTPEPLVDDAPAGGDTPEPTAASGGSGTTDAGAAATSAAATGVFGVGGHGEGLPLLLATTLAGAVVAVVGGLL